MQVNVAQLLKEPVGSTRTYDIDEVLSANSTDEQFLTGEIKFTRIEKGIFVKGEITTSGHGACARCLKPVDYTCLFNVEEEFLPSMDINTGLNLKVENGTFVIDSHHNINLTELFCQYTSMSRPMKLLCREDCAGICQICGQNLNYGNCNCKSDEYDARWSKLNNIKKGGKINGSAS